MEGGRRATGAVPPRCGRAGRAVAPYGALGPTERSRGPGGGLRNRSGRVGGEGAPGAREAVSGKRRSGPPASQERFPGHPPVAATVSEYRPRAGRRDRPGAGRYGR
ncbi:hypothetical protein GCM10009654_24250 [Streptomyces hebeiensis]|uniref:Uncharacterized protein n=1 Tax=Streptomyces hebeiensis TaxID=229486 RepID=A0ABN1UT63_9ACTN